MYKKIALNTIISVATRVVGTILALFSIGFITRHLGQGGFGEYSTILAYLYIFGVIADLGLYSLMLREISRPGAEEKKIASNIFTIRIIALFFTLILAPIVAILFPYSSQIKLGIIIGTSLYFFLSSSQVLVGIFQKYLKMERVALAELSGRVIQLFLIILFVKFNYGLFSIILAASVGSFLNFVIIYLLAQKLIKVRFAFDWNYWCYILKESLPIAATIVLTLVYFKLDTIMLSLMKPIEHAGIYNVGYKVLENIIFFPAAFVGLTMPFLSRYANKENMGKFKEIFQKTFNFLVIALLPAISGLFFLSLPIVLLIGGQGFSESKIVLQILSFAIGIIFLGTLFGNAIIALGLQKKAAWVYLAGAIANLGANFLVIPRYSFVGAAFTTILTEFIVTALMLFIIWRAIKYFPSFKIFPKVIFATLILSVFLYFFSGINMFLLVGFGVIIYLGALYLVKGVAKEEMSLFFRVEKNNN